MKKHIRNSLQILALTMGVSLTATAITGDNQKHSKKVSIANEVDLQDKSIDNARTNNEARKFGFSEKWFEHMEVYQNLTPVEPITSFDGGYYHKCYTNDMCYGVSLSLNDNQAYEKSNSLEWISVGDYTKLEQNMPSQRIILIGKLTGVLADLLKNDADLINNVQAINGPIIIKKNKWTDQDKLRLIGAYEAGFSIAIIKPTENELKDIALLLGIADQSQQTKHINNLAIYAVEKNTQGGYRELSIDDDTATNNTAPNFIAEESILVSTYLNWLLESNKSLNNKWLEIQVNAEIIPGFDNLEAIAAQFEFRKTHNYSNNIHQLTTYAWSVYKKETQEDWFYIKQIGIFSANNAFTPPGNGITDFYVMNTFISDYLNNPALFLADFSPSTTENTTTTTSGITWSLGGNLSFDSAGGGGGISAGVEINNSFSFSTQDVTVMSYVGTQLNNATWQFNISQNPNYIPSVGVSSFKPITQWIWKTKNELRMNYPDGLPITQEFITGIHDVNCSFWSGCDNANYRNSGIQEDKFTIPWPRRS